MKKLFFAAIAALLSFAVHAQQIDSVYTDTTTVPGPTYVRIKFPHDGFRFIRYIQADYNSYPGWTAINFWFKECTGTVGPTYYDTTLSLWIYSPTYLTMSVVLDANTSDTTCVLRPSIVVVDSFAKLYGTFPGTPTAVQNKEISSFSFYPNPVTNHRLTIEIEASGSKPIMATFYSLQGGKVATYTLSEAKTEITLPPHLPAGNYLLLLQTDNGLVERKLITVQ